MIVSVLVNAKILFKRRHVLLEGISIRLWSWTSSWTGFATRFGVGKERPVRDWRLRKTTVCITIRDCSAGRQVYAGVRMAVSVIVAPSIDRKSIG